MICWFVFSRLYFLVEFIAFRYLKCTWMSWIHYILPLRYCLLDLALEHWVSHFCRKQQWVQFIACTNRAYGSRCTAPSVEMLFLGQDNLMEPKTLSAGFEFSFNFSLAIHHIRLDPSLLCHLPITPILTFFLLASKWM